MLNTSNRPASLSLSEVPVSQLRSLVHILTDLTKPVPTNPEWGPWKGICEVLKNTPSTGRRFPPNTDSRTRIRYNLTTCQIFSRTCSAPTKDWHQYSGDINYPVPNDLYIEPERAYEEEAEKNALWEGEYGTDRREYALILAMFYAKELRTRTWDTRPAAAPVTVTPNTYLGYQPITSLDEVPTALIARLVHTLTDLAKPRAGNTDWRSDRGICMVIREMPIWSLRHSSNTGRGGRGLKSTTAYDISPFSVFRQTRHEATTQWHRYSGNSLYPVPLAIGTRLETEWIKTASSEEIAGAAELAYEEAEINDSLWLGAYGQYWREYALVLAMYYAEVIRNRTWSGQDMPLGDTES